MNLTLQQKPSLDPDLVPAALWNRSFKERAERDPDSEEIHLAILRPDGTCFRHSATLLSHTGKQISLNRRYIERTLKFLLWQKGGTDIRISGPEEITTWLSSTYSASGERAFDAGMFGGKFFSAPLTFRSVNIDDLPPEKDPAISLGGHLDKCRIGFDLGGSDRKCAAVIDGKVVFSEEIAWDPYFEKNPQYHLDGIRDSLKLAASHLPTVDAIGGSAAGVYVDNEVRAASLFRGVSENDFETHVRRMFIDLKKEWNDIPFDVVNDGEVTALAGSMSINDGALLGISMGTSEAAGYCTPDGRITSWLNELAFAPVDYRENAPVDEWSGDRGCGVQYFSQQGAARLATAAGFEFDKDLPLPERLTHLQDQVKAGNEQALSVFKTIGTCFGYTLAHYAAFYELRHVLILGRVTSGDGGDMIIEQAQNVWAAEFPELNEQISLSMPDEKMKRHGQAVAAASLPLIPS